MFSSSVRNLKATASRSSIGSQHKQAATCALGLFDLIGGDLIRPNLGTFIEDLEEEGSLGMLTPPEGGFEGRFANTARREGWHIMNLNARGLGDPQAYLTKVHGVRPPPLGKQPIQRFYEPGLLTSVLGAVPEGKKGVCLIIQEAFVLTKTELSYLVVLAQTTPNVKVICEMGYGRQAEWKPLRMYADVRPL